MNSDAGRRLKARNAKHAAAKPDEHAGQAVLVREGGDAEQAERRRASPRPGGEPVGVAEPVDRLHDHDDEQERADDVERVDAGGPEARAGDDRDQRGDGDDREPGAGGRRRRDRSIAAPHEREHERAERDDER